MPKSDHDELIALRAKVAAALAVITGDNELNALGACLRVVEILEAP